MAANRNTICNILLGFLLNLALPSMAITTPGTIRFHSFPVPKIVAEQVWFWDNIFSHYPSTNLVIHDSKYPHLIIDVIDFEVFKKKFNNGRSYTRKEKEKLGEKYIKRYELAIQRFKKLGQEAVKYGAMEKRVLNVYARDQNTMSHLFHEKPRLRAQTGLADEFKIAAKRAEKYLPYMEDIFRKKGLPIDLTRLAFVESMFNEKAISKVGASGVWQFMTSTARKFMIVNKFLDERNSPIKAAEGAASLLKQNYSQLRSWPLAITAYNHGKQGMKRAVNQVGSSDIGDIVLKYKSPRFGFASRNFYAEFIAAKNVYSRKYERERNHIINPMGITQIKLTKPVSVFQLLRYTPLTKKILKKYNRCFRKGAFSAHKYRPLPYGYRIIVPENLKIGVNRAIARIKTKKRNRRYRM